MKLLGHLFIMAAVVGGATYAFEHAVKPHSWQQIAAVCATVYMAGTLHGVIRTLAAARRRRLAVETANKV